MRVIIILLGIDISSSWNSNFEGDPKNPVAFILQDLP
jgi:hypothetical protein